MATDKFRKDAIWSYGSLAVQSIAGAAINIYLIAQDDPQVLGVFNQLFAIFVILGQLAVISIHDSVQRHIAAAKDEVPTVACAATLVGLITGAIAALMLALLSGSIGRWAESEAVGEGVLYLAPGLLLFVVNKILFGVHNGNRHMIRFTCGQALRALLLLSLCAAVVLTDAQSSMLGLAFTGTECGVMLFLVLTGSLHVSPLGRPGLGAWMSRHLRFGFRGAINSVSSEMFTRVDIVVLGILVSDADVGVYSFAAVFLEGLYMIPLTARFLMNPILARLLADRDLAGLKRSARRVSVLSATLTLIAGVVLLAIFPYFSIVVDETTVARSEGVLFFLVIGMIVYSPIVPMEYALLQSGRPGIQSLVTAVVTTINVGLNLLLIPHYGLMGAAYSTAIAFAVMTVGQYVITAIVLDIPRGYYLD